MRLTKDSETASETHAQKASESSVELGGPYASDGDGEEKLGCYESGEEVGSAAPPVAMTPSTAAMMKATTMA